MRRTSLSQTVPHSEDYLGDEEENLGDEEDNLGDEEDTLGDEEDNLGDGLPSVVLFVINLSSSSPRLSSECGTVCDKLVLLIS
jgi:hypothetical protein